MGKKSSVHYNNIFRLERAREQLQIPINREGNLDEIIKYTNEFLVKIGIQRVGNPKTYFKEIDTKFKRKIKKENDLKSIDDLVWMKFTKDGYLGVVATSWDINFDYPKDDNNYDVKTEKGKWLYNTSGILIHKLGQVWDEEFVLIFPLKQISKEIDIPRGDIECGIGNYLLEKGIPILDYYSHKF